MQTKNKAKNERNKEMSKNVKTLVGVERKLLFRGRNYFNSTYNYNNFNANISWSKY